MLISKNINRNSEHKRGNEHQYLELAEKDDETVYFDARNEGGF